MFRKIVSGLPFSPALVGQLGFYARRLKKEEASRRLGLIFTAMALVVQSFAMLAPVEAANSASPNDIIYSGVSTLDDILRVYNDPSKDFKRIMDYNGITLAEIKAMKLSSINSKEFGTSDGAWISWNRISKVSYERGERAYTINGTTYYTRPLWIWDSTSWTIPHGSSYPAFRGTSAKMGTFAIMTDCGNLATTRPPIGTPPPPPPPAPVNITVCRPGTGIITIKETEKLATDLPANSPICQPKPEPIVVCSSLSEPKRIERTTFSVSAVAAVQNGATISKYTFVVKKKDVNGSVVLTKIIQSTATSVENVILEVKDVGEYYVEVSITASSSANPITSANCVKTLTVLPPEKCSVNPELLATDKECQPCPGNKDLWYKDSNCAEKVASSKEATNLTQNGQLATKVTANGGDRIQFVLSMYNIGKVPATVEFKENVSDVLEYATIYDNGGGAISDINGAKYLTWGKIDLKAGEKVSRTLTVKVLDSIPLTARGVSDPDSFDCIMTNTFGNTVNINMNCPTPKVVEHIVEQLPNTGPAENMVFSGIMAAVVVFFYSRSRQLGTEVRLIRKDFNAGTL